MWQRIKKNFDRGIKKIKWFSYLLSERIKIEISIFKLLYQSEQLKEKRDELIKKIGERVYELKNMSDKSILKDSIVTEAFAEIEKINEEIESTKKRASEISSIS